MRKDNPVDPQIQAELNDLEAAFADVLEDTRPEPSVSLITRLDGAMDRGFASSNPAPAQRRWKLPPLRVLAPAGALAATIAVVAIAVGTTDGPESPEATGVQVAQEPRQASGGAESGATADQASKSLAAPSSVAPGGEEDLDSGASRTRQVERSAAITLGTSGRTVQQTTDEVVKVAGRLGGYVASSSVSVDGDDGIGNVRLRVPTSRLDDAMAALGRLGDVRSVSQNEQDITGTFSTAAAEVKDAKAERVGLLSALRRSTDEGQINRLRARLRENAARIAGAEQQLGAARTRAARATIDVQITSAKGDQSVTEPKEQGFGVGRALDAATAVLSASAGVLIVVVAAAIPLLALSLIGLFAVKAARRRSRERALDDTV